MECFINFDDKVFSSEEEMLTSLFKEFKDQAASATDRLSIDKFKEFLRKKKNIEINDSSNSFVVRTGEGDSSINLSDVEISEYGVLNNLDKDGDLSFQDIHDDIELDEDSIEDLNIDEVHDLVTSVASSINRVITKKGAESMTISEAVNEALDPIMQIYNQLLSNLESAESKKEKSKIRRKLVRFRPVVENVDKIQAMVLKELGRLSTVNVEGMIDVDSLNAESGQDNSSNTFSEDSSLSATAGSQMSKNFKRFLSGLTNTITKQVKEKNEKGNTITSLVEEAEINMFGMPTSVDPTSVHTVLSGLLAGSKPSYDQMMKILRENRGNYKWMPSLIENLELAKDVTKGELASLYSKHKVNTKVGLWGFDEEGNYKYYTIDQNEFAAEKLIQASLASNIKESSMLRVDRASGDYVMNGKAKNSSLSKFQKLFDIVEENKEKIKNGDPQDASVKSVVDAFQTWGNYIGLDFSRDMIENLVSNGIVYQNEHITFRGMLERSSFFGSINNRIEKTKAGEPMGYGGNYLRGTYVDALAKHQAKFLHSYVAGSHKNNEGNTITSFANNKYVVNRLRNLLEDEGLLKELRDNSIFMNKNNKFINSILGSLYKTDSGRSVEEDSIVTGLKEGIGYEDGISKEGDKYKKSSPNNMSEREHEVDRVNKLLNGYKTSKLSIYSEGSKARMGRAHYLTTSDKKNPISLNLEIIPVADLFTNGELTDFALEQMYESLVVPEINRMNSVGTFNIKSYEDAKNIFFQIPELNFEKSLYQEYADGKFRLKANILNDPDSKARIKEIIKEHVAKEVDNKLKKWEDIDLTAEGSTEYFATEYMNSVDNDLSLAAYDYIVNSMIVNGNIAQLFTGDPAVYFKSKPLVKKGGAVEMRSKFFKEGDLDAKMLIFNSVVDTYNNIGKRLAGDVAPGIELSNTYDENGNPKKYLQLFLEDKESMSHSLDYLSQLLDGKPFDLDSYEEMSPIEQKNYLKSFPISREYMNIEGTDAQEFTTLEEHLEVMVGMNDIDASEAKEILKRSEEETLDEDDIAIIFQPMKPVYAGNHKEYAVKPDGLNEDPSSFTTSFVDARVYIKSSSFPLIKQFTKNLEIDKLRHKMEEGVVINGVKQPFARAAYSTAAKIGNVIRPVEMFKDNNISGTDYTIELEDDFYQDSGDYDKKGDFIHREVKNEDGGTSIGSVPRYKVMNRENFRIQQEVPFDEDKDKVTDGTQQRKLLFSNILNVEGFKFNPSEAIRAMFLTSAEQEEAKVRSKRKIDELKDLEKYINLIKDTDYVATLNNNLEIQTRAASKMNDGDPDKDALLESIEESKKIIKDSSNVDKVVKDYKIKASQNASYMSSLGATSSNIYNEDGTVKDSFTGKELQEIYNKIYKQIFQDKSEKVKRRIGDYNADGSWNVDENKMRATLLQEAVSMDYPVNDQEIIKNKDLPLWFSMSAPKFEALLNSIFDGNVRKNKVKGNSFVLGSEDGFKKSTIKTLNELEQEYKDGIIYVPGYDPSLGLRSMRPDENGEIQPDEVLMPAKIRDQNGKLIDLAGYVDDNGVLDLENIPKEALEVFGYRIPTQGLNSMAYMRVVGFLPEKAGDLLITPKDFTKRMGSDFDVDKLFTSMPHLHVDEFGQVRKMDDEVSRLIDQKETAIFDTLIDEFNNDPAITSMSKSELRKFSQEVYKEYQAYKKNKIGEIGLLEEETSEAKEVAKKNLKQRMDFLSKEVKERVDKSKDLFLSSLVLASAENKIPGLEKNIKAINEGATNYSEMPAVMKLMGEMLHDDKRLKKLIFEQSKNVKDEFGKSFSEYFKEYRDKISIIKNDKKSKYKSLVKNVKTINALIALQKEKDEFKDKILQNQLFDIHLSVLKNNSKNAQGFSEVQRQIHKPIDFGLLKAQDAEGNQVGMDHLISKLKMKSEDGHFSALSPSYQTFKYMNGQMGKAGIGVFSLDSNLNILFQGHDIVMDSNDFLDSVKILGEKPNRDLSEPMDIRKERTKTDVIAAFQSAALDNENEQILDKLNINSETFDAIRAMALLGYDEKAITLLINQPIVSELISASMNLQDSLNENSTKDSLQDAFKSVMKKYESVLEGATTDTLTAGLSSKFAEEDISRTRTEEDLGFAQRQISAAKAFYEFTDVGKEMKRIQDVVKVDSSGLGKDLLTSKEKEKAVLTFARDFKHYKNVTKLIGNYVYNRPSSLGRNQYIEGVIKEKKDNKWQDTKIYVIPQTISGFVAKDALIANNQAWNDFFPYESSAVQEAFSSTLRYSDVEDNRISTHAREKKKIFQELKKFLNSNLLGQSVSKERNRLMYDQVTVMEDPDSDVSSSEAQPIVSYDHMSLANIIKTFKESKLKRYEVIQRMTLDVEQGNRPSTIKYGAAVSDPLSEQHVHQSFAQLVIDNAHIGVINGVPYSTRDLADDLVRYSYIEGGIQQATQFVKYIPAEYMTGKLFMDRVKDLNNNMNDPAYILNNTKEGETVLNPFTLQYFQHNPYKVKYAFSRQNFDLQDSPSGRYVSTPKDGRGSYNGAVFTYKVGKDTFIAAKLRKPLVKIDPVTKQETKYFYKVVSKLGDKGVNEYNRFAVNAYDSMSEKNTKALLPSDVVESSLPSESKDHLLETTELGRDIESRVNAEDDLNKLLKTRFDLVEKRLSEGKSISAKTFMDSLKSKSNDLSSHNKFMLELIQTAMGEGEGSLGTMVDVQYGDLPPNLAGTYRESKDGSVKTIIINKNKSKEFNSTNFVESFLHEAIHMVTADAVYRNEEQFKNLENLYDLAESHMIRKLADLDLKSSLGKTLYYITNHDGVKTKKDRMQEFLAHALTNKAFAKFLGEIKTSDVLSRGEASKVYDSLEKKFGSTIANLLDGLIKFVKSMFNDLGLIKNRDEGVLFSMSVEALYNVANNRTDYSYGGGARAIDGDINGFIDQTYKENNIDPKGKKESFHANGLKALFDITKDSPTKDQIVNFIERTKYCN